MCYHLWMNLWTIKILLNVYQKVWMHAMICLSKQFSSQDTPISFEELYEQLINKELAIQKQESQSLTESPTTTLIALVSHDKLFHNFVASTNRLQGLSLENVNDVARKDMFSLNVQPSLKPFMLSHHCQLLRKLRLRSEC